MNSLNCSVIVAAVSLLGCYGVAHSADPLPEDAASLLVLKNGHILRGDVIQSGDTYLLRMGDDEVRVPADRVDFACDSLYGAYLRKRSKTNELSAGDHVQLIRWCLRHRLYPQAADHLDRLEAIDSKHRYLDGLRRQLQMATTSAKVTPQSLAADTERPVSDAELAKWIKRLPQGTVEHYKSSIQPLLANSCGQVGCHGVRSTSAFRLILPSRGKGIATRFTWLNLASALTQIDRQQIEHSALVQVPVSPHGGTGPVFDEKNADLYERLVSWVRKFDQNTTSGQPGLAQTKAGNEKVQDPAVQAATFAQALPAGSRRATSKDTATSVPATGTASGGDQPRNLPDSGDAKPLRLDSLPEMSKPALPKTPAMRDPFDPAVFNLRYYRQAPRSRAKPPPETTSPTRQPPPQR